MDALIRFAFALDRSASDARLDPAAAVAALRADECAWVHLAGDDPHAPEWIAASLDYLDPQIIVAMTAAETRPRTKMIGDGVLLILRGVNTNEGAEPEDMVSVRVWADPRRVITLSMRRLKSVEDIAAAIEAGTGPRNAGDFITLLVERLGVRIDAHGRDAIDAADALEEAVIDAPGPEMRHEVMARRLSAIALRRYLAPQRTAIETLQREGPAFLTPEHRHRLHEAVDRLTRLLEDLDALRDRMAVVREELASQLSDRLNRNMYLISVLSAVFLPLGFLTGLFGINIAGMPGTADGSAFWIFSGAMMCIAAAVLGYMYWRRWF